MSANDYSLVVLEPNLEAFLRREGLLARFKRNAHVIGKCYYADSIAGAFDWRISYEGEKFWIKINKRYESSNAN